MRRKDFLKLMAASLLVPRLVSSAGKASAASFSREEERTIQSLLDTLWPGCLDSNAYPFLEKWLGIPGFKRLRDYFKDQIRIFRSDCLKLHKKDFHELGRNEKAGLMEDLYKRRVHLYSILLQAALMSVFGDPSHGVNPNRNGWKLIGYTPDSQFPFSHLEY